MQPLLDGDVILYELGFAAETGWQKGGETGAPSSPPPFDYVADLVDNRVGNICALANATRPPIFYFTGKTNFRTELAKKRKYKERPSNKPFHYYNIKAYIKGKWEWHQQEGLEADDLMAIEQTRSSSIINGNPLYSGPTVETIICTRDKDLRSVPGWHYGWELHNQPQFGPTNVDELGYVVLESKTNAKGIVSHKLRGTGSLFFYGQCLVGDSVDTVPGLNNYGPVKAFKLLSECPSTDEAFNRVLEAYRGVYGASAEKELLEQGQLLWMTRELDAEGKPVLWQLPEKNGQPPEDMPS